MGKDQDPPEGKRAALYVDGFNLYHPIHEKGEAFLKWASLWKLGEIFCRKNGLTLVKAVCCTAVPQDDAGKRDRHNSFNSAQIACGVTILKGHHVIDPESKKRSEKQSDINLALSLMMDAEDDVFDWAFLLSADSDQAATAKFFADRHPKKALVGVAPPTKNVPDKVIPYCISHFMMSFDQLEECIMPAMVPGLKGFIRRPEAYARPDWWMHPDDRPKKKPKE
ncbi:NYN domain-containing protein [Mesorhizobium sp. ES1-4]|uniref:NYN domain-containing protein n=1 Tax=Mesorhizobium sp. ES1-4 TaxID=2876627 RepID=UPI001CCA21E5|nr:NYN domain-containing protein [Mesorhizobium sp. ES1-4]MBZ9798878.1 NYN domain-containing protein [Mesorhizobium sp. ES1-4]